MCGRHFGLDLFDIASRFIGGETLKKCKISKNIQFSGPIFYDIQVVILLHNNVRRNSPYKSQFYSKNEKIVKIVIIVPFTSSEGSQSEEGRTSL